MPDRKSILSTLVIFEGTLGPCSGTDLHTLQR